MNEPTCATCQHWQPDTPERFAGACNGLISSDLVEITTDSETPPEIFTRSEFGCGLHLTKAVVCG